ncbi:MAG: hypothetical protein FWH21_00710 [Kiritimatiellaeota bacterium]|nr:hypothetical protein [Kiritimatiellota bacterium]
MKNHITKNFTLSVCLVHTTGLCFVSHSPQVLETRNWQLETDSYAHTYDPLNRVVETKVAQTFLSAFSHDPLGNLTAATDPLGKVRQWEYDAMNRRTAAIRPSGATDAFAYNAMGWNTAYTNSEGNVYTMAYDVFGRMTAATNALNQQVFRAWYDYNGNITNKIDGRGISIRSTYDALDRLTAVFTNGTANTQRISAFTYDAVGNMLTASNATAQLTFNYDVMNRVTNAVTKVAAASLPPSITTRWQRDLGGLVTNLTYATGKSVVYVHDEDGLLSSVTDWLGNEWVFVRDPAGRLLSLSSPSSPASPTSLFSYDPVGRLSSWNVGTLAGREISYDAANRRIRDDITAGAIPKPTLQRTALNTFDAADKLISSSVRYGQGADSTEHIEELFSYDGNGALTNWLGSPLWKGGGGNAAGGLSLTYNALGQVSSLAANSYSYDALGNRIKVNNALWIPNHSDSLKRPLMECDTSGNVLRYYIWGDNRLLGFIDSSGILTVAHCDDFGSVIALTDLSGTPLYTANYGSHGEDWGSTGYNPTPFAWLGGYGVQYLETDTPLRLYLTRHRVYSATLNRFLSADPIGLAGGGNLYAYGEGNPMAYIDPLGLCSQSSGWEYAWEMTTAIASGFWEGWKAGWEINFNTLSLGMTDSLGWTDSGRHEGFEYDVSRGLAAVGTLALVQAGGIAVTEVAGTALVNWGAGAAGVAGATAATVNTATQAIDPNKLNHVFNNAGHNITSFLNSFGGNQTQAYNAIVNASQNVVTANNLTGIFDSMKNPIVIEIGEHTICVGGRVINGIFNLGTAYIVQ